MSMLASYRPGDLGPPDDPDEVALDAIEEDLDFQAAFMADHVWEIVSLICTPYHLRDTLPRAVSALKRAYFEAIIHELDARRGV